MMSRRRKTATATPPLPSEQPGWGRISGPSLLPATEENSGRAGHARPEASTARPSEPRSCKTMAITGKCLQAEGRRAP